MSFSLWSFWLWGFLGCGWCVVVEHIQGRPEFLVLAGDLAFVEVTSLDFDPELYLRFS